MKKSLGLLIIIFILITAIIYQYLATPKPTSAQPETLENKYWFMLHRKSNIEYLYQGTLGETSASSLIRTFIVKTGIPGERPTPLPEKMGREYWLLINKFDSKDSLETAPYFLTLDVPYTEEYPYGPVPYEECDGQCNWQLPGSFGLHGIASDSSKIAADNLGSSGCIRHLDEDITYLYNLLSPEKESVRYYIKDI